MKDRLLAYCEFKGITPNAFEGKAGWSPSTIYNMNKGVRSDKLANVAIAFPDLDLRWLLTGQGEMLKEEKKMDTATATPTNELPMLPFSAVAGYLAENNAGFGNMEMCTVPAFLSKGADFLIRVEGDSMYPRYHNGEILAVKIIKDPTFFQWGKVYVLSTSQGCIVKRLFPDPENDLAIVCHSENTQMYPDYRITKADIINVGIVVGHIGIE